MRKLIDFYTLQLIRQNLLYFFSLMVFLLLTIFVLPAQIKGFISFKEKNQALTQEVADLERKRAIVASVNTDEIENLILTLNTLLPQQEDYFSIFSVLDNLSQLTEFKITGVSVSLAQAGPSEGGANQLSLQVTTEGAPEAFVAFLESYQYKGGRLITMDSINYDPETSQTSLKLNFYSQKVEAADSGEVPKIDKSRINLIKHIGDELSSVMETPGGEVAVDTEYPVRENPFGGL